MLLIKIGNGEKRLAAAALMNMKLGENHLRLKASVIHLPNVYTHIHTHTRTHTHLAVREAKSTGEWYGEQPCWITLPISCIGYTNQGLDVKALLNKKEERRHTGRLWLEGRSWIKTCD